MNLLLAFLVSWTFSDKAGNTGTLSIDATRVSYCTEGMNSGNASVSYLGKEKTFSVCLDRDVLVGIGATEYIDFTMELHHVPGEFAEWSRTREFENSPASKGCAPHVSAGATMTFGNGLEEDIVLKYFCLEEKLNQ